MHKRSILPWLGWPYVALIALWLVLRAIFFDQIWWLGLLNSFAIYLFVPLPLLLLASLWRRQWALVCGLAIPTAVFFVLFGTLVLPKPTTLQKDEPTITVMSFNVLTSNKDTDDASSLPLQRIDYIWPTAGLIAITADVGQNGGSDHLPVIVRLKL